MKTTVVTLLIWAMLMLHVTDSSSIDETVQSIRDRFETRMPSEQSKLSSPANVVSILEKELSAETEAIVRGFKEMTGRIDRDLRNSGEEEMKHLMRMLKSHSSDLRRRFSEMSESVDRNIQEMLKESDTATSEDETSGLLQYLRKIG